MTQDEFTEILTYGKPHVITGTMASEEASNSIRTLVLDVNNNDFNYVDHKSVEWLVVDDVLYTNDPSKVSNAT